MAVTPLGYKRNVREFSSEEIARLKATFKPSATDIFSRDEKPYLGPTGAIIGGCDHVLDFAVNQNREWERSGLIIGGLDAHLCKLCSCWWVDSQMRGNILTKRTGFSEAVRDNGK